VGSLHPRQEPVAWLTLLSIIIQVVIGFLSGHVDTSLMTSLTSALIGVGVRQSVWSPVSHYAEIGAEVAKALEEAAATNKKSRTRS